MGSREEQKQQREKTSRALIQAALDLSAAEGYGSLSLRSVARRAAIAPTSFYRHFRDMDELGLAMVDQARHSLRQCLERTRKKMTFPPIAKKASREDLLESLERMVRPWVETFMECASGQGDLLRLFFQERTGSSRILRTTISDEIEFMIGQLVEDLERVSRPSGIRFQEVRSVAEAMVTLACAGALDVLVGLKPDQDQGVDRVNQKLCILLLGATVRA